MGEVINFPSWLNNTNNDTHVIPQKVIDLIEPQSSSNNLSSTLTKKKLDELFTNLHTWIRRVKDSDISNYEMMQEFLTPMQWIEEIRNYNWNTIQTLGFQKRFETSIPEAYLFIWQKLWIPQWKNLETEIFRLYEVYKTPIEKGEIWK